MTLQKNANGILSLTAMHRTHLSYSTVIGTHSIHLRFGKLTTVLCLQPEKAEKKC